MESPVLPYAGNLWELIHDMAEDPLKVARNHGDLARFQLDQRTVVLVSRPEWVGEILVTSSRFFIKSWHLERIRRLLGKGVLTSEGDFHMQQRRQVQQAFHGSRMENYCEAMIEQALVMREGWKDGQEIDVDREMHRLTLQIVGKTLFDADVGDSQARDVHEAVVEALRIFPWMAAPLGDFFDALPFGPARRFLRAKAKLDAILYEVIHSRRQSTADRGDLLSILLTTDGADGVKMSDEQLRDELMTIFTAGHETTANALSWTWLLLSRNPEVEERLHEELDRVLGGRVPRPSDVDALDYTRCVLAESMRIYPPVFLMGRQNVETYRIGEYEFAPGTGFFVSPYVSHRDPRYFPDPERFDPERFRPEVSEARPKFCYYPFGAGSRMCLGERFAWSEGILLLATLAQRFRLRLRPNFKVRHRASVVLCPRGELPMTTLRR